MKSILFSMLVVIGACGGGSKATPAQEPATATTTEPAAPAAPAAPTAAEEPAKPAEPDPAQVKADLLAAETTAFEAAKPVFTKFCESCHVQGKRNATKKKLEELDITSYPFAGKHNKAKDIREVLAIGGGKPTMPKGKPGAVKGDDLALIAAWADAWDAAEQGGAHAQ